MSWRLRLLACDDCERVVWDEFFPGGDPMPCRAVYARNDGEPGYHVCPGKLVYVCDVTGVEVNE